MRKKILTSSKWLLLLALLFINCTADPDEPQLPQNVNKKDKITVVIIGSSIASGQGASDYSNSWAGLLKAATKDSIINNAKGGYTTFHFLPETISNNLGIETDVKRNITTSLKLNPDMIIFSITTNDIANGFTANQYIANMKTMTDLCELNHVSFLVGSTTPRLLDEKKSQGLIEVNNQLKSIYKDKFVDYYHDLVNSGSPTLKSIYDSGDNTHPNNAGHGVIYNAFYPVYLKTKKNI
ncbi:SGNH/GDSL hydrolase family protein [Flavobacterium zhairuonense]|uniref:SGNH/GDSL hydrolase family protein n=1 Tax=Flavobacterium zhairuonense TaxID=2493631 RepID=UPI0013C2F1BD|nr:SGNH/GDSL hydrolase family protein [Flavobacterium zhairuonense]KAF2509236.1 SGNH/GDSL hydrolase family protein [Flavobacterium zhairuonense]